MNAQLGIDGQEQPVRVCECGCGASLDGKRRSAIYASASCRTRHWKHRTSYSDPRRRKASRNGRSKPSGLQVSFWKAQRALEEFLEVHEAPAARNLSLTILMGALSVRQRAELCERKRAKRAPTLTVAEQRAAFNEQEATHA